MFQAFFDRIPQDLFLNNLVPNDMHVNESSKDTVSDLIKNHYFEPNGTITCEEFDHVSYKKSFYALHIEAIVHNARENLFSIWVTISSFME